MARNFNGTSQSLVGAAPLVTAAPLTAFCWGRVPSVTAASSRMLCVVDDNSGAGHLADYFTLRINSDGTYVVAIFDEGVTNNIAQTTGKVSANVWFPALGIWSSNSSVTVRSKAETVSDSAGTTNVSGLNRNRLGARRSNNADGLFLAGDLAFATIWNVVLSTAEGDMLLNGIHPLCVRADAIKHHWALFGNDSPEIDWVGGDHLTLVNSPTASDSAPPVYWPRRRFFGKPGSSAMWFGSAFIEGSGELDAVGLATALSAAAIEGSAEAAPAGAILGLAAMEGAGEAAAAGAILGLAAIEGSAEAAIAHALAAWAAIEGSAEVAPIGVATAFGAAAIEGSAEESVSTAAGAVIGAAIIEGSGELAIVGLATAFGLVAIEGSGELATVGLATAFGLAKIEGAAELAALHTLAASALIEASAELAISHVMVGAAAIEASAELIASHVVVGAAAIEAVGELAIQIDVFGTAEPLCVYVDERGALFVGVTVRPEVNVYQTERPLLRIASAPRRC